MIYLHADGVGRLRVLKVAGLWIYTVTVVVG